MPYRTAYRVQGTYVTDNRNGPGLPPTPSIPPNPLLYPRYPPAQNAQLYTGQALRQYIQPQDGPITCRWCKGLVRRTEIQRHDATCTEKPRIQTQDTSEKGTRRKEQTVERKTSTEKPEGNQERGNPKTQEELKEIIRKFWKRKEEEQTNKEIIRTLEKSKKIECPRNEEEKKQSGPTQHIATPHRQPQHYMTSPIIGNTQNAQHHTLRTPKAKPEAEEKPKERAQAPRSGATVTTVRRHRTRGTTHTQTTLTQEQRTKLYDME